MVIKIMATIMKKLEGRKFPHLLLAHQAETNLPSVAEPGPYVPDSTAPHLDELPDKCVLNIVRRIMGFSPFPS